MTTLIFVHGACVRDAAWWWAEMTKPLADNGISSVAVPLPSCGETGDELGDLYADVQACRTAISAVEAPREIAWRQKPTTYIVCTEDLATPPDVQHRRVKDQTRVVEFSAGHHPFLSRPDDFAQSLAAAIEHNQTSS
jgi:hypothetical protein